MNATTQVTNIASSCCHTFMLGKHSVYDANCVTTSSDFPIFAGETNMEPSSRWFSNQWDEERLSKCSRQLVGIWVNEDDGTLVGDDGYEDVLKAHLACMERPIKQEDGDTRGQSMSFNDIVDKIGRDRVKIMN